MDLCGSASFILHTDNWLYPRPICLLILLWAEWKSMDRDTFGGPSACHITHQSVGSGYLDPVTRTVAERGAWLISSLLQIADQWLRVGQWIFPIFPLFSALFFCFALPLHRCRCMMYVMFPWGVLDDWHKPPGKPAGWLAGRSSPTRAFDTIAHTYTHSCQTLYLCIMMPF